MLLRLGMMYQNFLMKMNNEEGQGLVEYALILVLVSIVVIAMLLLVGQEVEQVFDNIQTELSTPH